MTTMVAIPDRENLETMSRTDIQKLCKDNNIKANMRTDEMINALCELANGNDAPRTQRSKSERVTSQAPTKSRLPSRNSIPPKATESSPAKKALQPSESNTDADSVADTPMSAPTTRRKAKEIQTHLGKGRPAVAGGSGARNVTKTISRGTGRKAKASAMLQEDPIPEEDEENTGIDAPTSLTTTNEATRPSSVRPQSRQSVPSGSHDPQPSQLPTPAPSQPSYSLPSVQLSALETRVAQLENPNLAARILQLELSMAELPALKVSVAQIPVLQAEVRRLEADNLSFKGEVGVATKVHTELKIRTTGLEAHVAGLVTEKASLKERVAELEARLMDCDASTGSVVIHSPREEEGGDKAGRALCAASTPKRVVPADPSPSQPTLGKRNRSETPDVVDGPDGVQKQRADVELQAIHRVTRPQRKKARLELDVDDNSFPMFKRDRGGPSSTSTPRQRRSDSPPGFFTVGRRAPTPLARRDDLGSYLHLDPEESGMGEGDASEANAIAGPSNSNPTSSADGAPQIPPPSRGMAPPGFGAATFAEQARVPEDPAHDPGFFGDPLPVFYTQDSELPYPLNPSTPPNTQDILEQSAQFATPMLGEPWKYNEAAGYVNPANISQLAESVGLRMGAPSSLQNPHASSSAAADPRSPGSYTFRAGGRRERNDKYNPYFTPQRGPSARHRTGLTPTRAFSVSLKSPAKMTAVIEGAEAGGAAEEDGVEGSPPQLRTLYGTELDGDTRFGDYGTNLGKFDWGKYLTR